MGAVAWYDVARWIIVTAPTDIAPLLAVRLPLMDVLEASAVQRAYADRRKANAVPDTVLLARHPPTFCTGVLGKDRNMLATEEERRHIGVPYVRLDRGGDLMYVGPGQVVAYPIVLLADLGLDPIRYLRLLEEVVIRALADFRINAVRIPGSAGVWVGGAKIAGVAVKVSGGVTTYGFNLNVDPDLAMFRHIVTCGNMGRPVTSMAQTLGLAPALEAVEERVVAHLSEMLVTRSPRLWPPIYPHLLPPVPWGKAEGHGRRVVLDVRHVAGVDLAPDQGQ